MKIRRGYVSNSSSSSFIVVCDNKEAADRIIEAYAKYVQLWKELHPKEDPNLFEDYNYHTITIPEIIQLGTDLGLYKPSKQLDLFRKHLEEMEAEGKVFLNGNCSNEDGTSEYIVMLMFNEWVINTLGGHVEENLRNS